MYKWPLMQETITYPDRIRMAWFALTTKRFTSGDMVKRFENEWNEWLGSKNSLFVSSGSTANFLLIDAIMKKYNIHRGDKVLLPSCTWMTNVAPVIQLGLMPIFADISLDTFSFDIEDLHRIKKVHPDIKLIFVTHLLGIPAENNDYQKIFPDAIMIDDVCESHGCKFPDGSRVGSNSIGATFSFYFGHHMTTIEGGMISTKDDELYDIMKMKRSHGLARESLHFNELANRYSDIDKSFLFITDGYNFRNHEIPAVLGSAQLKRLDNMIQKRRINHMEYQSIVSDNSDKFHVPKYNEGNSSFCFPFISHTKEIHNRLKDILSKNEIEYRPVVSGNLLTQPFLNGYSMASRISNYNVDSLENGLYIGNNHFVDSKRMLMLREIISEV